MSDISFEEFIIGIINGAADENLDTINSAIKSRQKILNSRKMFLFNPGDIVMFNRNTRPKYLQGQKAKVVKINRTTVTVFVSEDAWGTRKYRGTEVRVPFNLVDKEEK